MNTDPTAINANNCQGSQSRNRRCGERAFALIELFGILAVMAILAAAVVPALIRQMDKIAGDQESAALKSFGDALQQSIMRKRYIPSYTDWATNVATELGVDPTCVTNSPRGKKRLCLIDPNFKVGTGANNIWVPPYTQTSAGSIVTDTNGVVIAPVNPRIILLSSVGPYELPGNGLGLSLGGGVPTPTVFNAIWDWNDTAGTLPADASTWGAWSGKSDDLKVQRVNLSPLFVHLILTTNVSESAYYSIDSPITTNKVRSPGRDGYFIRNSILYLCKDQTQTNLDSQQILTRDTSFVYEQNVWRSSLTGGSFLAGSLDLGSVVDKYLEAPENTNAANTTVTNSVRWTGISQQSVVVSNMTAYMKAYTNWAASGFSNNSLKDSARAIEANMVTAVLDQYQGGNPDRLPHPIDCQP